MIHPRRHNAIIRLRSLFSRRRALVAFPFLLVALMLWNQAYVPLHMLLSHSGTHGHSHGHSVPETDASSHSHEHSADHEHVAAPKANERVYGDPSQHGHGAAGHSHSHEPEHDSQPAPAKHRHSVLDHMFALGTAVHPHVLELALVLPACPSAPDYSEQTCDGLVPSPTGRGPPVA